MDEINERLSGMSNAAFAFLQIVCGLVIAVAGGCCILFLGNNETEFNSIGLAAAFVICGGFSTFLRSKIQRPTPWFRWSIVIGLVAILGIYIFVKF